MDAELSAPDFTSESQSTSPGSSLPTSYLVSNDHSESVASSVSEYASKVNENRKTNVDDDDNCEGNIETSDGVIPSPGDFSDAPFGNSNGISKDGSIGVGDNGFEEFRGEGLVEKFDIESVGNGGKEDMVEMGLIGEAEQSVLSMESGEEGGIEVAANENRKTNVDDDDNGEGKIETEDGVIPSPGDVSDAPFDISDDSNGISKDASIGGGDNGFEEFRGEGLMEKFDIESAGNGGKEDKVEMGLICVPEQSVLSMESGEEGGIGVAANETRKTNVDDNGEGKIETEHGVILSPGDLSDAPFDNSNEISKDGSIGDGGNGFEEFRGEGLVEKFDIESVGNEGKGDKVEIGLIGVAEQSVLSMESGEEGGIGVAANENRKTNDDDDNGEAKFKTEDGVIPSPGDVSDAPFDNSGDSNKISKDASIGGGDNGFEEFRGEGLVEKFDTESVGNGGKEDNVEMDLIGVAANDAVLDIGVKVFEPMVAESVEAVEVIGSKFSGEEELAVDETPSSENALGIKETEVVPVAGNASLDNGFNHVSEQTSEIDAETKGTEVLAEIKETVVVPVLHVHPPIDTNGNETTEVLAREQTSEIDAERKADVASGGLLGIDESRTELNDHKEEAGLDMLEQASAEKVDGGGTDGILVEDRSAQPTEIMAAHETEDLDSDSQSKTLVTLAVEDSHLPKSVEQTAVSEEFSFEGELEEKHHQNEGNEIGGSDTDGETESMFFENADESHSPDSMEKSDVSGEVGFEGEMEEKHHQDEGVENGGSESDAGGKTQSMFFENAEAAKQFLEELERGSAFGSYSGADTSHDHSEIIDGQVDVDTDEEGDADEEEEEEGKELFDSAALAALLKAATGAGSDGGNITITSQDGSNLFSVERPAGLGSSLQNAKPASRSIMPNIFSPAVTSRRDSDNNLSEEDKIKLEKLQLIRVKFLRLVQRLGLSAEESVAAQVLYRLALVAGRQSSELFSIDSAKRKALELETEGKDDLDFSLNILVLGKIGVGKSATINSIFGEVKTPIHAFEPATAVVKEITGIVDGIKLRVIDTPGMKSSAMDQVANRKVLASIKQFIKKCPPDVVVYVDRLDTPTRDLNDLPLLRSITNSLGSSIWKNAIVALTHAASAPPDGPSGSSLSYEVFVAQRSHVVQQSIGQAVGDLRMMSPSMMNPVCLVENHPSCRKNRDGHKVLPNGQTWRPQLVMLCCSIEVLSEASSLSKPQDPFDHRKLFGFRVRSPPLPYLLSWLLQSRSHPKLAADQGGENGDSDIDIADLSDSDHEEEEDEYDQLPPFKPLRKVQLAKLNKAQMKAYFEEYDYRVKLLQQKQWREELRRMREMKKGKPPVDEFGSMGEDVDQEDGGPAAVPVPLPDMVLPPSFDGQNPAYRYRFLEPTSQFLARPVLDTHGWDHDIGYDGVNVEHSLAIASQFPAAVSVQLTKDKKEFNIHLDSSVSAKHGENGSTMAGFDIQNVGKQLAYVIRGETKFKNLRKNKTAAGFSVTFLGENVATGLKLEDHIALGKRLMLTGSTGTVRSKGDSAYGANLEIQLRDADFPIGQDQSTLGLSLVKWRGDLALGANFQSQFSVGRSSKIAVRAGLNNKMSGQITVRTSSSDQLQIALTAILPIVMAIYKTIRPGVSDNYSMY